MLWLRRTGLWLMIAIFCGMSSGVPPARRFAGRVLRTHCTAHSTHLRVVLAPTQTSCAGLMGWRVCDTLLSPATQSEGLHR